MWPAAKFWGRRGHLPKRGQPLVRLPGVGHFCDRSSHPFHFSGTFLQSLSGSHRHLSLTFCSLCLPSSNCHLPAFCVPAVSDALLPPPNRWRALTSSIFFLFVRLSVALFCNEGTTRPFVCSEQFVIQIKKYLYIHTIGVCTYILYDVGYIILKKRKKF